MNRNTAFGVFLTLNGRVCTSCPAFAAPPLIFSLRFPLAITWKYAPGILNPQTSGHRLNFYLSPIR